jgi:hypothetical protein
MAREKKPQVVATVKHVSGVSVDITLHPNSLEFAATVIEGVSFKAKNADEVHHKVNEYLDKNSKIDWIQVIQVVEQKPFAASDYAFIGIELDRFYVGFDTKGECRSIRWCDFDDHWGKAPTDFQRIQYSSKFYYLDSKQLVDGKLKLPVYNGGEDCRTTYLAYTEPVWLAVNQIRDAIAALKTKLRETITTDEGIAKLADFGSKMAMMLPAPKDEIETKEIE